MSFQAHPSGSKLMSTGIMTDENDFFKSREGPITSQAVTTWTEGHIILEHSSFTNQISGSVLVDLSILTEVFEPRFFFPASSDGQEKLIASYC